MSNGTVSEEAAERPQFRGCVFCYSAEWAYYGAKKAVGSVTDRHSSQ